MEVNCKTSPLAVVKLIYKKYPYNINVINHYINIAIQLGEFSIAKQLIHKHFLEELESFSIDRDNTCPINLHIGVHKTATTYVQNTLQLNSQLLENNDIGYISLEEIRQNLRINLTNFTDHFQMLDNLFASSVSKQPKKLIFSEENLISSANMLIDHIYGHAEQRLNKIKFYFSEIYGMPIDKVIITLRSYDSFFQSFFLENNRHRFVELSMLNKQQMLDFSWKILINKLEKIFGKDKIKILFFEDIIKNENLIFDELTDNPFIYSQLQKSDIKRKSPNYIAYQEVEQLYSSNLQDSSKDFLRFCLMYPDLLQNALESYKQFDSDAEKILNSAVFALHTHKMKDNLIFSDKEVIYLRDRYQKDKQEIKEYYTNWC